MTCQSCRHGREIIKQGVRELMFMFASKGEDGRKAFYIQNVKNAWTLWKEGKVPFEWAGFVHHSTKAEFHHYFQEDLDAHLPSELLLDLKAYKFDIAHGGLYQILIDKFKK